MIKVFTNGCFDVIHRAHIELLQYCRNLGDIVIVGINSDKSVQRLKGPSRPINNQEDRHDVLKALRCVDYVFVFEENTPYNLIKTVNPAIIVKGGDYTIQEVVGNDLAEVKIFNYLDGYSTTNILERGKQ
jgi:rfaE bifunctional protein nucleotidyltransferase chain/domain